MGTKEDATRYFTGSLSEEGFNKRKRAAEEEASRDKIQTLNWQNRVRVAPKKRPGKHSPKKG